VAAFFDVSLPAKAAFTGESLLWFTTTTAAFQRIRHRRVLEHREWMIRSFSLAFFFVTFSLWPPLLAATALPPAIGYPLALFLSWSLNLIAAEWWIRRTRSDHNRNVRPELGTSTRHPRPPLHSWTADAPSQRFSGSSGNGTSALAAGVSTPSEHPRPKIPRQVVSRLTIGSGEAKPPSRLLRWSF
jgi:hypothetical protein